MAPWGNAAGSCSIGHWRQSPLAAQAINGSEERSQTLEPLATLLNLNELRLMVLPRFKPLLGDVSDMLGETLAMPDLQAGLLQYALIIAG